MGAYPAIVTLGIALVLALWAAYALSGAGLLAALPFLKWCLAAITAVYLLRGLAVFPLFLFAREQATPFLVWSSVICIGYGVVHLVGIMQALDLPPGDQVSDKLLIASMTGIRATFHRATDHPARSIDRDSIALDPPSKVD